MDREFVMRGSPGQELLCVVKMTFSKTGVDVSTTSLVLKR